MDISDAGEKIIVTGIKNSIIEILGFINPKVDKTIDRVCPIVNKVTIQNSFWKYFKVNGIVIEIKNKKWSYAFKSKIWLYPISR